MSRIENEKMILSYKESKKLVEQLMNPNLELIKRRDEFTANIGTMKYHDDGRGLTVEVLDFDTSFLDNIVETELESRIENEKLEYRSNIG